MQDLLLKLSSPPDNAAFGSHPLTIALAAAFFWILFGVFEYTQCLVPKKAKLNRQAALEWNISESSTLPPIQGGPRRVYHQRIDGRKWTAGAVSTVHALFLVAGSYFCLWDSLQYGRDGNVFGYSFYPDFFARVFLGYLIYDLSNLSVFFKTLRDYSGMIHHGLFILVTAYVLAYSIFKFPFLWLSFGEASTPFVNLRWRLAVLGKKESMLYLINGLALACTFFVARVLANGLGLLHLWQIRSVWLTPEVPLGHKCCVLLFLVGYMLNLYWFLQIARGVRRALFRDDKAHVQ